MHDQLFASFMLDKNKGLEIALKAENVSEATSVTGTIKELPASIDYLEGIMTLRDDIIPVINLKKRLGLDQNDYNENAKVAVVNIHKQRFGLLFDDIREVFSAEPDHIMPLNSLLQSEDKIISALIKLDQGKRTIELLDLFHLFQGNSFDLADDTSQQSIATDKTKQTTYSRWVVFTCLGQAYGVPVKYSQEITFFSDVDDMFKTGHVEGAIQLRGDTIPVMNSRYLLADYQVEQDYQEENRVLILASDGCLFGMMVDEINEILTIADDTILSVPSGDSDNLLGIYPQMDGNNIMLLDMPNLVCNQIEEIKSLSRINQDQNGDSADTPIVARSHHLITENCYLIFAIHKNFAVEIKDVQEIIDSDQIMTIPKATGYSTAVINLRGEIIPVINTRNFFGYADSDTNSCKLIICKGQSRIIALMVDHIVTIYKQEQYHSTPSLNPQLAQKKDTLDRLIEYEGEGGLKEHVLVVNMHNLVRNHLEFKEDQHIKTDETESEIVTET